MPASAIGHGIYTYAEAVELTGVGYQRVHAWFRGRHRDGRGVGRGPVFAGDYPTDNVISFLDLIEVLVAGHLRKHGASLIAVRKAYANLAAYLDTTHPFSRKELLTDGRRIFVRIATTPEEQELIELLEHQHIMLEVLLRYLKRVEYDAENLLAYCWHITEGVIVDPARRFGKPIVETSGMPTAVLSAAYHANCERMDLVADWYGVSPIDVKTALLFESRHSGKAA